MLQNFELLAILRVLLPLALHLENLTGHGRDEIPDDGDKVTLVPGLYPGDSEAGLLVAVGDPFDLALKFHDHPSAPLDL